MGRRSRRIALAPRKEQRTQTRTGAPAAAARRYLMHGPPRRPRRAAAPSPRLRQRWRRAPSSAQPPQPLGAILADLQIPARQLARQLRLPPCESLAQGARGGALAHGARRAAEYRRGVCGGRERGGASASRRLTWSARARQGSSSSSGRAARGV